jgi:hypothetical protein
MSVVYLTFSSSHHLGRPNARVQVEGLYSIPNMLIFYAEKLLTPIPSTKQEVRPWSDAHNCVFNIFVATFNV